LQEPEGRATNAIESALNRFMIEYSDRVPVLNCCTEIFTDSLLVVVNKAACYNLLSIALIECSFTDWQLPTIFDPRIGYEIISNAKTKKRVIGAAFIPSIFVRGSNTFF